MRNIKPLNIGFEPGCTDAQMDNVVLAARIMLQEAGVGDSIEVRNFGIWRNSGYRDLHGNLVPYYSSDWYIKRARETSERQNQLNADTIIDCLQMEPWQQHEPHYDLVIVHSDMYACHIVNNKRVPVNFVTGLAIAGLGTVVSTHRFMGVSGMMQQLCIQTLVLHELGHVFGLIPSSRTLNVERNLGRHCTNVCVMRQGLTVPSDCIGFTQDRLRTGNIFCTQCQFGLRQWFN